ncbi:MAG: HU family DNA-binding protein, partial [Clostridia bacterium]|nr:HU family DNA-binding protein [Clostridia bacterium]
MNKAQLINALVNTAKLSRRDADVAVNSVFDLIIDEL